MALDPEIQKIIEEEISKLNFQNKELEEKFQTDIEHIKRALDSKLTFAENELKCLIQNIYDAHKQEITDASSKWETGLKKILEEITNAYHKKENELKEAFIATNTKIEQDLASHNILLGEQNKIDKARNLISSRHNIILNKTHRTHEGLNKWTKLLVGATLATVLTSVFLGYCTSHDTQKTINQYNRLVESNNLIQKTQDSTRHDNINAENARRINEMWREFNSARCNDSLMYRWYWQNLDSVKDKDLLANIENDNKRNLISFKYIMSIMNALIYFEEINRLSQKSPHAFADAENYFRESLFTISQRSYIHQFIFNLRRKRYTQYKIADSLNNISNHLGNEVTLAQKQADSEKVGTILDGFYLVGLRWGIPGITNNINRIYIKYYLEDTISGDYKWYSKDSIFMNIVNK